MRSRWMFLALPLQLAGMCSNAGAQSAWHLQLVRSIKPVDGSAAAFNRIANIAVGDDGTVYVAEVGPARVSRYDSHGNFTLLARNGEGPGEVHDARVGVVGDTALVYDGTLDRFYRFSAAGKVVTSLPRATGSAGGSSESIPVAVRGGGVIVRSWFVRPDHFESAVRITKSGTDTLWWSRDSLHDRNSSIRAGHGTAKGFVPFSPFGVVVIDPDGHVVSGGSAATVFTVRSPPAVLRTTVLPAQTPPIHPAIRDSVYRERRARLSKYPDLMAAFSEDLVPTTLPPWVSLAIDPTNRWWLGRSGPRGELAGWQLVIDGRIAGQVSLPAPIESSRDEPGGTMAFGRNFVALVHENEDGVPWIGVYRLAAGDH